MTEKQPFFSFHKKKPQPFAKIFKSQKVATKTMKLHFAYQSSMMLILWTVYRIEAVALRGQIVNANGTKMIASLYEGPPPEMKVDDTYGMKSRSKAKEFACNVTFSDSDKSDKDGHRFLEDYSLSTDENYNAGWVQYERESRGLQSVYWSADLILEAQRWSRYLASIGSLKHRNPLDQNLESGWRRIAENVAYSSDISYGGAHTNLMNSPGHRANILNRDINRIGVGVTKAGSGYYFMVHIFKQV